jgi:hypothetical protein
LLFSFDDFSAMTGAAHKISAGLRKKIFFLSHRDGDMDLSDFEAIYLSLVGRARLRFGHFERPNFDYGAINRFKLKPFLQGFKLQVLLRLHTYGIGSSPSLNLG